MMDPVAKAIFITQIPIAIGIIIAAYELWLMKKELMKLLNKLTERVK